MGKKQLRNLILFTLGNGVSTLGSVIYSFAIGLFILNTTGSGIKFAITLIVSFVPMLVITPFAGVFADRFDKKTLVVVMDLLNGFLFLSFFLVISISGITTFGVYITAFLTNIITTVFGIAMQASKPQLVKEEHYETINAISQLTSAITAIIGPILGGIIFALIDMKLFILFNGFSFVFSGISEIFIDFKFNSKLDVTEKNMTSVISDLKDGFKYVTQQELIMKPYKLFLGLNILLSLAVQVPLPYILNTQLNVGSKVYGIIFGALPFGLILGAILVSFLMKKIAYNRIVVIMCSAGAVLSIFIGLPYFLNIITENVLYIGIYYSVILFLFGVLLSSVDIPFTTLLQKNVDEVYHGRVWGVLMPMVKAVNPLCFLLSGLLIEYINPFVIPLITGSLYLIFIGFSKKHLLEIEEKKVA